MSDVEVKVPIIAESTAKLLNWQKQIDDKVREGERLIEVETDKVVLEILAPQSGKITKILKANNEPVSGGEIIAILDSDIKSNLLPDKILKQSTSEKIVIDSTVRKISCGNNTQVSNKNIAKSDKIELPNNLTKNCASGLPPLREERVPMTHLRNNFAKLLLKTQSEHVILTVFDEVNMQAIKDLRTQHKQSFEQRYGTKLELMAFFIKAVVAALQKFPIINASTDNNDIIYHNYYNIGITNSNVVPVLRNADTMSFADIETNIADFTKKINDSKLAMEELTGGTFTITNIPSSMLSTPILNSPQSAILGIHNIVERPVVENGQVVIRPIMFIALSYDQRLIDNNDAVQFLVTVKNAIEDPSRLLLEI